MSTLTCEPWNGCSASLAMGCFSIPVPLRLVGTQQGQASLSGLTCSKPDQSQVGMQIMQVLEILGVCVCVCVCVCVHICTYVYMCVHTHVCILYREIQYRENLTVIFYSISY